MPSFRSSLTALSVSDQQLIQSFFSRLIVENQCVRLPVERIDAALYTSHIKPALTKLGGKWSSRKQGFEFAFDPTARIQGLLEGERVNLRSQYHYFDTPSSLAGDLFHFFEESGFEFPSAHQRVNTRVLEPSAGQGNLLKYLNVQGFKTLSYFELMDENRQVLNRECERLGILATCLGTDFLGAPPQPVFDLIVANPPFRDEKKHFAHMFRFLKDGGHCMLIASPKRYMDDSFGWFLSENLTGWQMRLMEGSTDSPFFEHTAIGCVMIVGKKRNG